MNKYLALDFVEIERQALPGFEFNSLAPGLVGIVISRVLPLVYTSAGIILLFMLLSGGLTLMSSKGDPKKVQGGKDRITYAFYGFIIIIVSFWIVQIVGLLFGINIIGDIFGTTTSGPIPGPGPIPAL